MALVKASLELAGELGLVTTELRARHNLGYLLHTEDPTGSSDSYLAGLELARTMGDRAWEVNLAGNVIEQFTWFGRWSEAEELIGELQDGELPERTRLRFEVELARIAAFRGDPSGAARTMEGPWDRLAEETDLQVRRVLDTCRAWISFADGRLEEAYGVAVERAREDPFRHISPLVPALYTRNVARRR
ncbi:MAG: hypothetical protein ACRDVM_06815 [Acidimicrobiia bacterium]